MNILSGDFSLRCECKPVLASMCFSERQSVTMWRHDGAGMVWDVRMDSLLVCPSLPPSLQFTCKLCMEDVLSEIAGEGVCFGGDLKRKWPSVHTVRLSVCVSV